MHCAGSPSPSSSDARRGEEKRAKGKWKRKKKRRGRKWEKRAPANKRNCLSLSLSSSPAPYKGFLRVYTYTAEKIAQFANTFTTTILNVKRGRGRHISMGKLWALNCVVGVSGGAPLRPNENFSSPSPCSLTSGGGGNGRGRRGRRASLPNTHASPPNCLSLCPPSHKINIFKFSMRTRLLLLLLPPFPLPAPFFEARKLRRRRRRKRRTLKKFVFLPPTALFPPTWKM